MKTLEVFKSSISKSHTLDGGFRMTPLNLPIKFPHVECKQKIKKHYHVNLTDQILKHQKKPCTVHTS